jgi:DNA-binding MarR family transcriptional regulator
VSDPTLPPGARFVEGYLGYLLGQANHALYKDFEVQVRAAGLTPLEWRVLATLHDSAALPVSTLAREVLSQQPTVTKLVQRMRAQDWVSLQDDASDQRRTLVAATATGEALIRPLLAQAQAHEARILASLDGTEVQTLKTLLGKLALK